MYYVIDASVPSLHRESTDSLIVVLLRTAVVINCVYTHHHNRRAVISQFRRKQVLDYNVM